MVSASTLNEISSSVLRKVRPNLKQKKEMKVFSEALLKEAKLIGKEVSAVPMLCGSVSKNTWIRGKFELDLFFLFDTSLSHKQLSSNGLEISKKLIKKMNGKYEIAYAEHPYVRGKIKYFGTTYQLDIVPCFGIKNLKKIKSSVDRTPHHVQYVKKKLTLPDDVRLLKQFCKANGCYGADVKTQGFSGYLCELLILNYGKFSNLVKAASKWRAPVIIDLEKEKINHDKLFKKFKSPLILIDPVDSQRNVAAAVSPESFYKLVSACSKLTKKPSSKLFFERKEIFSSSQIKKLVNERGTKWYMIKFERPDVIDDILWPQMRRTQKTLDTLMTQSGFEVLRKDVWADENNCLLLFEMKEWKIPRVYKKEGPNIYTKHSDQFLRHYKSENIFIEGDSWYIESYVKYRELLDFLKDHFSQTPNYLKNKGVPARIAKSKFKIYSGNDAVEYMLGAPKDFRVFLRRWFEKNLNVV